MDECRITPARIKGQVKKETSEIAGKLLVEYQPLIIENNNLKLGNKVEREVWSEFNDKAFVKEPKVGDWVSLHWDWVCDVLTPQQAINLDKWNQYNLSLFNV